MTQFLREITATAVHVVLTAAIVVALIKLDISLAAKALLVGVLGYAYFLIYVVENLLRSQTKLLGQLVYFQRVTYIAAEMSRLEPDNVKPARDIFADDTAGDRYQLQLDELLVGERTVIGLILLALYVALVALVVFVALKQWPAYA